MKLLIHNKRSMAALFIALLFTFASCSVADSEAVSGNNVTIPTPDTENGGETPDPNEPEVVPDKSYVDSRGNIIEFTYKKGSDWSGVYTRILNGRQTTGQFTLLSSTGIVYAVHRYTQQVFTASRSMLSGYTDILSLYGDNGSDSHLFVKEESDGLQLLPADIRVYSKENSANTRYRFNNPVTSFSHPIETNKTVKYTSK